MKELVTVEQANHLMLVVLVAAPLVGLLLGAIVKQVKWYTLGGLAIGAGNYVMWTVYNAITDRIGLDTVKNLVVNLVLFIVVGIVIGAVMGKVAAKNQERSKT
ncbi:MAG: hypothetical protein ACLQVD_13815 [Capsulimonadaceae bacterium]